MCLRCNYYGGVARSQSGPDESAQSVEQVGVIEIKLDDVSAMIGFVPVYRRQMSRGVQVGDSGLKVRCTHSIALALSRLSREDKSLAFGGTRRAHARTILGVFPNRQNTVNTVACEQSARPTSTQNARFQSE